MTSNNEIEIKQRISQSFGSASLIFNPKMFLSLKMFTANVFFQLSLIEQISEI